MDHEPLLAEAFLLVVGVFSSRIDLAQRQLAVAKQTADEALLHHHRLHAVDVDALEAVLQQAVLNLDAVVAATCAEAAVRDASADGRQQPQHERRSEEGRHARGDEAAPEQPNARGYNVANERLHRTGEDGRHLTHELGNGADDADNHDEERRVVRQAGEHELLVGHAVLVGHAARIHRGAAEHAAHVLPDLGGSVQHIGALVQGLRGNARCRGHRRNGGIGRGTVAHGYGVLLAREQLGAQLLGLRLLHIGHLHGLVVRAACRIDAHRAHAEHALDERGVLVDGLDALVGHMHALLVEYARIQVEFLGP